MAARPEPHDADHVLALVQEQMGEIAAVKQKRSALTATGSAAEGTVQVTVDANRTVTKTMIDESYLDDFEFVDLSGHITTAAQAAARDVERQSVALFASITERRNEILSFSRSAGPIPSLAELISALEPRAADQPRNSDGDGDDKTGDSPYPILRR